MQLAVEVNGHATNEIGAFTLREGVLSSLPRELAELGFRVPVGAAPETPLPLSALKGLTWQLDEASQTLRFKAEDSALVPLSIRSDREGSRPGAVQSGTGAVANYNLVTTASGGRTVAGGVLDLRGFSSWGTFVTGALANVGGGPRGPGRSSLIRLDSAYSYADPDSLRQYVAGDFITGGLNSSRPVRLAGLQISSNFALRPDLVTFPLPTVGGSVAVPSTLDVLLDGNRYLTRNLVSGPFEVPQLPVVSGAGTVTMAVTNALGQQVSVDLPVYASSALLTPGLQSYSVQLGLVRRRYGLLSDDYGTFAGVATYRRGIIPALTLEATVEASRGLVMGGGGMVLNLGGYAVLQASAEGSMGASQQEGGLHAPSGTQVSAGVQRVGRVLSLSASATLASAGFRDLASVNGDFVARLRVNAGAGVSLGRFGSLGATYTGLDRSGVRPIQTYIPPGLGNTDPSLSLGGVVQYLPARTTRLLSASYSTQAGPAAVFLTGFKDIARGGDAGVVLGLSIPLGPRSSAGATGGYGSRVPYGQAQVQQTPVSVGDWGYRASGAYDTTTHGFGELSYKSPWGLFAAGADRTANRTAFRAEASGAGALLGGSLFAANTIADSFAVIDTDGVANIGVLQENRPAGRTDAGGKLLVTGMRSFDINRLAIDANDVAADMALETTAREVRPQYRSGVVVRFPMQRSRGALLRLVDEGGAPVPLGSVGHLRGSAIRVPVGFDGEAYVERLDAHAELDVELPDGRQCRAAFDYRPVAREIPKIGPVPCRAVAR